LSKKWYSAKYFVCFFPKVPWRASEQLSSDRRVLETKGQREANMLILHELEMTAGLGMIATAITILGRDLFLEATRVQKNADGTLKKTVSTGHLPWLTGAAFALLSWGPMLVALGLAGI
jgi:hypothetical protein